MILFIPGFGGSKIYCMCNPARRIKLYPKKNLFGSLTPHFFECANIQTSLLKTIMGISIYSKFLKNVKDIGCEVFPYDWRQTALENAIKLRDYLDISSFSKITLVGHSMGGLLIRILIEHLHYTEGIVSAVICGTPLYGSMSYKDYNPEYLLYLAIINDDYTKLKTPFHFSQLDCARFFKRFQDSLKFLMPSFTVRGRCNTVTFDSSIVNVHRDLGKFSKNHNVAYYFYFNNSMVGRREFVSKCNFLRSNPSTAIVMVRHVNQDGVLLVNEKIKTDGLVVFPSNVSHVPAIVHVDKSPWTHSLLMNHPNVLAIVHDAAAGAGAIRRRQHMGFL